MCVSVYIILGVCVCVSSLVVLDIITIIKECLSVCLSVSYMYGFNNISLSSSSSDRTVKVWDTTTRQCKHTFKEHNDQVCGWYGCGLTLPFPLGMVCGL